jgi:hypothetical protein
MGVSRRRVGADLVGVSAAAADLCRLEGEFWVRVAEFRRGGLPSGAGGGGSRSAERPLPLADRQDRELERALTHVAAAVARARRDLDGALRTVQAVVLVAEGLPDPVEVPCQRLDCSNVVSQVGPDRLRPSRVDGLRVCPACVMRERRARKVPVGS